MKSRVIGEEFTHPTMGKLMVVQEGAYNECFGCAFNDPKTCLNDPDKLHTGSCVATERMDKTGVIFVKQTKED